jgi:Flp pilus assembly protein TadG
MQRAAEFCRQRTGAAAAEFALLLPLLVTVMVGVFEFGYYLNQAITLENSLRSGAMLAARSSAALTAAEETAIVNVVRKGNVEGSGDDLLPGWSDAASNLQVTTSSYSVDADSTTSVIRLDAEVRYSPLMIGVLEGMGLGDLMIRARHEQTYVGN